MATEWSVEEDGRPGRSLLRTQPEKTGGGVLLWTWLVEVNWPMTGRTQVYIRDCSDQFLFDHGRVYPLHASDEDGA